MNTKELTEKTIASLENEAADKAANVGTEAAFRAEQGKEQAWCAVWARASKSRKETEEGEARVVPLWRKVARVAAALIPLAIATIFVAQINGGDDFTRYAATGSADTLQLADGSTVILGEGSELAFRQTNSGKREAKLTGIALFKVRHDEAQPFTVDADNATVRVLGTTFSVEHWPGEERVRTRVEQGLVAMSAGSENVRIKAGEEAIWTGTELSLTESAAGKIAIGQRRMDFRSASLRQVVDEMLTCYHGELNGVKFDCGEDTVLITTSFVDQSLESVVEELNLHFDKKLALHNGYLTISD